MRGPQLAGLITLALAGILFAQTASDTAPDQASEKGTANVYKVGRDVKPPQVILRTRSGIY